MPSVLFVCLGNICRSPLAEGALRHLAARGGVSVTVDSAGTGGWHVGEPPDRRAQTVARRHGVEIGGLRGRQVAPDDFSRFDHVVALDHDNLAALRRLRPAAGGALLPLLLDHVPGRQGQAVADPYYGDERDFEIAWAEVSAGAAGLLRLIGGG
ncbi:MAG: low molecular weight phosphotyrosine protein phosphatase [Zavarzinia sp.]|nr:low molecular weight phosphotyrosine protein phosphatase [Zavarzinia sp.]